MQTLHTYLLSGPQYDVLPPANTPQYGALAPHFGRLGIGIEEATPVWPSDSLFAALVAQAALLGAEGAQFIAAMTKQDGEPLLRHSSLFPRIGNLVLLPRPALPRPVSKPRVSDAAEGTKDAKAFKKLRYLSPGLFKEACKGEDLQSLAHVVLQDGEVWVSEEEARGLSEEWRFHTSNGKGRREQIAGAKIWHYASEPHVTVDRASSASAYYEAGRVFFAPGCGLALLTTKQDTFFERLLELLGEGGIGGRRSVGNGAFSWTHGDELKFNEGGERVVTLSRFLPRGAVEIEVIRDEHSRYQLVEVGGWTTTSESASFRRKEVTMLAEGAVLAKCVRGTVVDVRSDTFLTATTTPHPIYRSGLALTVPLGVKEDEHGA